jgi:hypothetical protein
VATLSLESLSDSNLERPLRRHREVLAIACSVFVLAFLLRELPDGRVTLRGLPEFPLPQACASRALFGLRCPGCGLTRSIIHIAEGNWQASWHDHRLGGLMAILIAVQIPYRLYALRRPLSPPLSARSLSAIAYVMIALLLGNWLFDVAAGRLWLPQCESLSSPTLSARATMEPVG